MNFNDLFGGAEIPDPEPAEYVSGFLHSAGSRNISWRGSWNRRVL